MILPNIMIRTINPIKSHNAKPNESNLKALDNWIVGKYIPRLSFTLVITLVVMQPQQIIK